MTILSSRRHGRTRRHGWDRRQCEFFFDSEPVRGNETHRQQQRDGWFGADGGTASLGSIVGISATAKGGTGQATDRDSSLGGAGNGGSAASSATAVASNDSQVTVSSSATGGGNGAASDIHSGFGNTASSCCWRWHCEGSLSGWSVETVERIGVWSGVEQLSPVRTPADSR
jgi:hypothetical protein